MEPLRRASLSYGVHLQRFRLNIDSECLCKDLPRHVKTDPTEIVLFCFEWTPRVFEEPIDPVSTD
jgi:hypothetical protein